MEKPLTFCKWFFHFQMHTFNYEIYANHILPIIIRFFKL
jgi:hypothetical protein